MHRRPNATVFMEVSTKPQDSNLKTQSPGREAQENRCSLADVTPARLQSSSFIDAIDYVGSRELSSLQAGDLKPVQRGPARCQNGARGNPERRRGVPC